MSAGKKADWVEERFMMSPGTRAVESLSTPGGMCLDEWVTGEVWVGLTIPIDEHSHGAYES